MSNKDKHRDVNKLLKDLFGDNSTSTGYPLKELFTLRLEELSITKHQACKIIGIQNKSLDFILEGDAKKIDFITIHKLAYFLNIPQNQLISNYLELVKETNKKDLLNSEKRSFIVNNFDLAELKKIGMISSINDFESIENSINRFFGYDSIFEYGKNKVGAVLSSGKRKSGAKSMDLWFETVYKSLEVTPNPNDYNRKSLIEYFPEIRRHCMDVEKGLIKVAQKLFSLGITLIVIPKLNKNLHLRAATVNYRDKPCIALTKYTQFYPSLWFALIHELFHVLYDWEIIQDNSKHFSFEISDNHGDVHFLIEDDNIDEDEANEFARQYLFSKEKLDEVYPHINEPLFVKRFAKENHVHPSFIYIFYLREYGDSSSYAKFNKYFPKEEFNQLLNYFKFNDYLKNKTLKPLKEISRERNLILNYNM